MGDMAMRCERRMRPTSRGVNNLDIFNFGTGGVRTVYEKSIAIGIGPGSRDTVLYQGGA